MMIPDYALVAEVMLFSEGGPQFCTDKRSLLTQAVCNHVGLSCTLDTPCALCDPHAPASQVLAHAVTQT